MGLIDKFKRAADLAHKFRSQELYEAIMDLREDLQEVREENLALREENSQLIAQAETEKELVLFRNRYYLETDKEREQPYCMTCWDANTKLITLKVRRSGGLISFVCNLCRSNC